MIPQKETVQMPIDPARIISIIRELEETSPGALKEMDRELLLSIKRTLQEHKREVDKMLLRLAFADEQQLN
jgi:BMFP domain-containing protein YqiC